MTMTEQRGNENYRNKDIMKDTKIYEYEESGRKCILLVNSEISFRMLAKFLGKEAGVTGGFHSCGGRMIAGSTPGSALKGADHKMEWIIEPDFKRT